MRSRNPLHNRVQKRRNPFSRPRGDFEYIVVVTAQKIDYLVGHNLRLGGIHVYLVHHRDDLKSMIHSQIEIGDRLCLDSL